jgi:hypothetical protein
VLPHLAPLAPASSFGSWCFFLYLRCARLLRRQPLITYACNVAASVVAKR